MINRRIGKIKVRRGTDDQRIDSVFEEGLLVYSLDKKRLFVGDGNEKGGILVSNKNYIVDLAGSITPPNECTYGDIIHDKPTGRTYIVDYVNSNDKSSGYTLILIADNSCCAKLQAQIDALSGTLKNYAWCTGDCPEVSNEFKWLSEPINIEAVEGNSVSFTAEAVAPDSVMYSWELVGTGIIPNQINKYLDIHNVKKTDIGYYRCLATSPKMGTIVSKPASLNVVTSLFKWVTQPTSVVAAIGSTATLNANAVSDSSITYIWKRKDGSLVSGTSNSNILTINSVKSTDYDTYHCEATTYRGANFQTITSFDATIGSPSDTNLIKSEDDSFILSEDGQFLVEWNYGGPALAVYENLSITKQADSIKANAGGSATFTVQVAGSDPKTYVWKKGGVAIANSNSNVYTIASVKVSDVGEYTCEITNPAGTVVSEKATLEILKSYENLTVSGGGSIVTNYDLCSVLRSAGWDGTSAIITTVTIAANTYIGSRDTSKPAFRICKLPTGSKVTIINNGYIIGAGGAGGIGGSYNSSFKPTAGKSGGDAIMNENVESNIILINNSIIGGGGGGGGGGNGYGSRLLGGNGGIGAGFYKNDGTISLLGQLGTTFTSGLNYYGANGGNLGENGASSGRYGENVLASGIAGKAIVGKAYMTIQQSGDASIKGLQI